jgi:aryl-alcohol dehydrogenase-like predicted oxidoreductase
MITNPAKIALGTVQFGLAYGISNKKGQVSYGEVKDILRLSTKAGIDTLDTAYDYGTSEEVLGKVLKDEMLQYKIVSKLPVIETSRELNEAIETSLRRLNQAKIYGYLIHDFDSFINKPNLWNELKKFKRQKVIQKIGFSLYYPHQLETLEKCQVDYDMIQVPFNVFDQRFVSFFPKLRERGVEIHTRSIFLQGLFFKKLSELPEHFNSIKNKIIGVQDIANKHHIQLNELLLGFGLLNENIDRIIIGVDSIEHLQKNLTVLNSIDKIKQIRDLLFPFKEEDEAIILPFNW